MNSEIGNRKLRIAQTTDERGRQVAKRKVSFEEHLSRLEEVVRQLEGGDLALDEALTLFEEGIKASKSCGRILDGARTRVQKLVAEDDGTFRLDMLEE